MPVAKNISAKIHCYHCGDVCPDEEFNIADKYFCCFGCKTVYEILNENDLCTYYDISKHPGITQRNRVVFNKYAVLDRAETKNSFIRFTDGQQTHVTFYLPVMHCSSCIWLLEHLHKLNAAIIQSRVDFPKKEISIIYDEQEIPLSKVAELLDAVGYEPLLSLQDAEKKTDKKNNKTALIKIGIAGFAFGNIMLMAFPEYFAGGEVQDEKLNLTLRYLSLFLALPVFFYCANEFYISSVKSLKNKFLNIDVPIAIAIILTFARSLYAVFIEKQAGYFDSMTGIVFFMLVGRYFQNMTYKTISFERNYKSYFPLSVSVINQDKEEQMPLSELKEGDIILVRNHELIPADAILINGNGNIDYSFVTGEAEPVAKKISELIYAGGKQIGAAIKLRVIKEVSQSYLTQLWNNADNNDKTSDKKSFVHILSRYFAVIVLVLSSIAFIYWLIQGEAHRAMDALITPMIVACPCALLLSATFTNGNAIRYFGKFGIYLKNAFVIEKLTKVNTIVFDKTGTLTKSNTASTAFEGELLTEEEKDMIVSLAAQSVHPYSKAIKNYFGKNTIFSVSGFEEIVGKGAQGIVNGQKIKIGSAYFNGVKKISDADRGVSYISINDSVIGKFNFQNKYRSGLEPFINKLKSKFKIYVLSGDNNGDVNMLKKYFAEENLYFNQSPHDKLKFIKNLRQHHNNVMMLGDGLNDAGALQQSDTGVAVSQGLNFTPASDIVLDADQLINLHKLFAFAKRSKQIIIGSFILSIVYNIFGLYFALQGLLSPVVAAILMPLSTITIVSFTTGMTTLIAMRLFKNKA